MKFFPSFSFPLIFFYFLLYSPSYDGSGRNNVRLDLYLDKETCDLTCVWTKWLVTWLDLTSDQMTCDLTWTCKEMTCDLTWTCKEMTCDLTWTCKKWLAVISDKHAKLCLYVTIHAASSMLRMQPEVNNPNSRVVAPKSRGRKLLALSLWQTRGSWQSIYIWLCLEYMPM